MSAGDSPIVQNGLQVAQQAQAQAEQAPDIAREALRVTGVVPTPVPSMVPSTPPPGKAATHASLTRLLDKTRSTLLGRMVDRYQLPKATTAVNRLHGDLKSLAQEGEPGRMWYEKSSKRILDYVQGDKDEAHKIAQLIAIYSPQTAVSTNTSNAVKAYNRAKSGETMWAGDILEPDKTFETIKQANEYARALAARHGEGGSGGPAGSTITKVPLDDSGKRFLFARHNMAGYENIATADRDLKAHLLMREGIPFEGRKTNNFYRNLMVHIDPSIDQGSTQDLWMARAFGFHDDAVSAATKYDFMEKLTDKLARELGWRPHQVQAAIWTAMKTRQEAVKDAVREEGLQRGMGRMVTEDGKQTFKLHDGQEDAYSSLMRERALEAVLEPGHIARSARDFSDFLDKNIAHVSWEATPGRDSGHLTGLSDLSPEKRADYHKRISEALQDEQGNDHLAKYLGLLSPGTVEAPGYWQGDVNPASHLQVATTRIKAAGQRPDIDLASKQLLNTYADARGLLLKQDGVGYHRPHFDPQVTKANGIEYNFDRDLTADEIRALGAKVDQIPGSALVPSGPSKMRVLHFGIYDKATDSSTPLKDHRPWHKTVDSVLSTAVSGATTARQKLFASDGDLRGNNWKDDPHGENYTRRLGAAGRSDVLEFVSNFLAPKVEAVDQAFAQEHGLKRNQAIEQAIRTYGSQEGLMGRRFRRADGGSVIDPETTQWRNVRVPSSGPAGAPYASPARNVEVAVNPTHDELKGLVRGSERGAARLSKDTNGNVYAWDAEHALHDQVASTMGFKPDRKAMTVIGQLPVARLREGKLQLTDVMGNKFNGVEGWHRRKRADGGRLAFAEGGCAPDVMPGPMTGMPIQKEKPYPNGMPQNRASYGTGSPSSSGPMGDKGAGGVPGPVSQQHPNGMPQNQAAYGMGPPGKGAGGAPGLVGGGQLDGGQFPQMIGRLMGAFAKGGRIGFADGGPVEPQLQPVQQPAPADDGYDRFLAGGLYSHAAEEVWKQPQLKASPQQFKAMLTKRGVKPDEFKWSGYDQAFAGRNFVSKREVRDHFINNTPQIQETVKWAERAPPARYPAIPDDGDDETKYQEYQLPGGQNYREILLHLPSDPTPADIQKRFQEMLQDNGFGPGAGVVSTQHERDQLYQAAKRSARHDANAKKYSTTHWNEPNVLAHLRLSDRTGPNNQKVLHLEELQSDWGQAARDKGIKQGDPDKRLDELEAELKRRHPLLDPLNPHAWQRAWDANPDLREENQRLMQARDGVPAGPYIDSTAKWTELGLKRALYEAAKGGYDKLVVTPGEEQAKRYDLSKHIKEVHYTDTGLVHARDHNGNVVIDKHTNDNELPSIVGKELADKLIHQKGTEEIEWSYGTKARRLSGLDLKVGGEGMTGYYDTILPRALEKLARQHDSEAKVQLHGFTMGKKVEGVSGEDVMNDMEIPGHEQDSYWRGLAQQDRDSLIAKHRVKKGLEKHSLHAIDITPQMRAGILKGQKAFASGGKVGRRIDEHIHRKLRKVVDIGGRYPGSAIA